ncbi:hypothetical protein D3C81_1872650 [compost metagenome]
MRWISITAMGSTPANGSSSRMKRGLVASARAISTRRRSPPDSEIAALLRMWPIWSSSSKDSICSLIFGVDSGRPSAPTCNSSTARMFCSTVSRRNTEASCGRYDRPMRARLWIGIAVMTEPSISMRPASAGTRPTIM